MCRFIHGRYTLVPAVWPMILRRIGRFIAVWIDSCIQKRQKRIMRTICARVLSLTAQYLIDRPLAFGHPRGMLKQRVLQNRNRVFAVPWANDR